MAADAIAALISAAAAGAIKSAGSEAAGQVIDRVRELLRAQQAESEPTEHALEAEEALDR
jgi:hypothetical protein